MKSPALALCLIFLAVASMIAQSDPIHTSMIQLVANPEKFHGKLVQVSGYLHNKFEDTALYLSKEDADYLNGRQAIWLVWGDKMKTYPKKTADYFDGKHVSIIGIFDKEIGGHLGMYTLGGIRDVSDVTEDHRFYDGKKKLKD